MGFTISSILSHIWLLLLEILSYSCRRSVGFTMSNILSHIWYLHIKMLSNSHCNLWDSQCQISCHIYGIYILRCLVILIAICGIHHFKYLVSYMVSIEMLSYFYRQSLGFLTLSILSHTAPTLSYAKFLF